MDSTHKPAPVAVKTADRPVVLVIDDDPVIRRFIESVTGETGLHCHGGGSLDDARAMSLEHVVLVVLDLSLGGGDAVDVLDHLANQDYGGGVMLITGYDAAALDPVQKLGKMTGLAMWPYLTKPIRPSQLRRAVESLTAGQGSPRDGGARTSPQT